MPYSEAWSVSACWGDSKGNDLQKNQGYSPVYCLKDTSPGLKEQPHMAADRLKGGFLPPKICNLCNHVSLPSWWNYPFAIQSSQLWFYSWQCFLHFPFFPSSNNHVEQIFCVIFLLLQKIDAQAIEEFYGLTSDISKNSESGYILFYQSRE